MGVHTKFEDDDDPAAEMMVSVEKVAPLAEEKEEEEDEDVSICPVFTNEEEEDDDDLPRRNLDADFASQPTLPKKRRMLVDNNAPGVARQLPVARVGLGGATGDELSLERMQVSGDASTFFFFPLPSPFSTVRSASLQ